MEVTVGIFVSLIILAVICEFIDSSVGMGYGTILSPLLILIGFDPLMVIPAVLFSQAFGGFAASIFHHKFENVSFRPESRDFKIALVISGFGIIAAIMSALISISISKVILKTYIGILVLVMGIIILRNYTFSFSWKKIVGIGVLSAFNKGLSGGGFGPVVTAGQIIYGRNYRRAIGATTLAEAPICIVAFLTYMVGKTVKEFKCPVLSMSVSELISRMFSRQMFQWKLILALLIGSVLVAPFGAFTTKKLCRKNINIILGALIITLGIWTLYKTYC